MKVAWLVVAAWLLGSSLAAQAPVPKPLARPGTSDVAAGAKVFEQHCARCHGFDGSGGMGPPLTRARLRRAATDDELIAVVVLGLPGTSMPGGWSLSETEAKQVAAYVRFLGRRRPERLPGDPARGRAVYERLACATCHLIDGQGAAKGPDLSDVGTMRGAAYLRESIVSPAAARPERAVAYEPYGYPAYLPVRVRPRGGADVTGVRLNEDAFTIQIRDGDGRLHSLRKADLDVLEPDASASLMPSYRDNVSEGELGDLVAYLMTRRAP